MTTSVTGHPEDQRPLVRLPTWVNVVLVLILLGSCGDDARAIRGDSESIADQVVSRLDSPEENAPGLATRNDVKQVCQLLTVVARQNGLDLSTQLGDIPTACQQGVSEALAK